VAQKAARHTLRIYDHIRDVVGKWEGIVQADDGDQFATFNAV
jgi:hypothetical protein